jgi:hypothetical protein
MMKIRFSRNGVFSLCVSTLYERNIELNHASKELEKDKGENLLGRPFR